MGREWFLIFSAKCLSVNLYNPRTHHSLFVWCSSFPSFSNMRAFSFFSNCLCLIPKCCDKDLCIRITIQLRNKQKIGFLSCSATPMPPASNHPPLHSLPLGSNLDEGHSFTAELGFQLSCKLLL